MIPNVFGYCWVKLLLRIKVRIDPYPTKPTPAHSTVCKTQPVQYVKLNKEKNKTTKQNKHSQLQPQQQKQQNLINQQMALPQKKNLTEVLFFVLCSL